MPLFLQNSFCFRKYRGFLYVKMCYVMSNAFIIFKKFVMKYL